MTEFERRVQVGEDFLYVTVYAPGKVQVSMHKTGASAHVYPTSRELAAIEQACADARALMAAAVVREVA